MVTKKQSLTSALPIVAKPVGKSGRTAPKVTSTTVEGIWSVDFCRKNPEKAAQAIEMLQWLHDIRDQENIAVSNVLKTFAKDLLEFQEILKP